MGSVTGSGPLVPAGVDFSNETQAFDFLQEILGDGQLAARGNEHAQYFWYGVFVVIGITSIYHWTRWLVLHWRLGAAAKGQAQPARPKSIFTRCLATITALAREATYLQFTPTHRFLFLRVPPVGTILLIMTYLAFVLALEFVNNNVAGAQHDQALSVRAAWLAIAQVPLIILLVGKHNLISMMTGVSYVRLNVLHRWAARIMLLMVVFHFGFEMRGWSKYGLVKLEWRTDTCPPTGIAAFAVLLWMNLSTIPPLRYFFYEFFVVQHIITFFGFIIAVMIHIPTTALNARVYVYIPIALYLLDRVIRTALFVKNNFPISRATLTPLDGGVTKIRISNSAIKSWSPGSFVLLSIPRFGLMQTHPATIASTPSSHNGDMVFMLKSHGGFTKRVMISANSSMTTLLPHTRQESASQQNAPKSVHRAFINGPYGGYHSDFAVFDSVCLIAGSTGITFTLAILQNLAERAECRDKRLPTRRIHFVWCVKETNWTTWVNNEITASVQKLRAAGIVTDVSVYVTCADMFTEQSAAPKECGCACDKTLGPCCCVAVDEEGEGLEETKAITRGDPTVVSNEKDPQRMVINRASSAGSSSNLRAEEQVAVRMPVLPCALFFSGRPEISTILNKLLDGADGESGVAVCGPIGLTTNVRNDMVRISDERAIHKGSGAQGCYLHVETYS